MRPKIDILLCFVVLGMTVCSTNSLAQSHGQFEKVLADWNKGEQPGGAVGVFKDGKILYSSGFGYANLEYHIKSDSKSVFRIASTSKQFTAAAVILLVQKGRLNLDDPLSKFFPNFPKETNHVTVRQLLNHTSGFRDYLTIASLKGLGEDDYYQDRDVMSWLVQQRSLNFQPGEEYLYSNSGYWLLSQIVEKSSGKSLADFAQREIFGPLKMKDTHFHDDHRQIVRRRASGYASLPGTDQFEIDMTTLDLVGDGGVFTTIDDLKKWDDAFYSSKVLNQEFWKLMTTVGTLNNGKKIEYASGLIVDQYRGLKTVEHSGAFAGFRSAIVRFPEQKTTVVILGNRSDLNANALAFKIADIALKGKLKAKKVAKSPKVTKSESGAEVAEISNKSVVGSYQIQPGIVVKVTLAKKNLKVTQLWNNQSYEIVRKKGNTFGIPNRAGLAFTFMKLRDGKTFQMDVLQGGRSRACKRVSDFDSSKVKLPQFAGDFYSKELDTTYSLTVESKKLMLSIGKNEPVVLNAVGKDEFAGPGLILKFSSDDNHKNRFFLMAGRATNIKFEKIKPGT